MTFQTPDLSLSGTSPAAHGGIHVPAAGGATKWWSGDVYTMKLTAQATNGALGVIQASVPAGGGPPAHAHAHSDEMFFLLSGELEFLEGDRLFTAQTGDLVFIPRTTRHRFRNNGPASASMLFLFTPGGPEGLFVEAGEDPRPGVLPQLWGPDRIGPVIELAGRYDQEVLPEP